MILTICDPKLEPASNVGTGAFSELSNLSISFGLEIWELAGGLVNRFACNHMDLNYFCFLGWKIEMIESFCFFT